MITMSGWWNYEWYDFTQNVKKATKCNDVCNSDVDCTHIVMIPIPNDKMDLGIAFITWFVFTNDVVKVLVQLNVLISESIEITAFYAMDTIINISLPCMLKYQLRYWQRRGFNTCQYVKSSFNPTYHVCECTVLKKNELVFRPQ